jgi:5-methylcytosine-specific restriction endonuclease McrA
MTRQEKLEQIALRLRRESPYFHSGWNINVLQAYIRDGGRCAYCERELLSEFCLATGDHLLPKQLYPQLAQDIGNLVPCCIHCNRMKHDYDPSEGEGKRIVITADLRKKFVEKTKQEIARKKREHALDIGTGKIPFARAVAEYQE